MEYLLLSVYATEKHIQTTEKRKTKQSGLKDKWLEMLHSPPPPSIYYTGQRQGCYKPTRLSGTLALKASEWAGGQDLTRGESCHSLLGLAAMLTRRRTPATGENKTRGPGLHVSLKQHGCLRRSPNHRMKAALFPMS